ncbi:MAG: hypothetical protein ACXVB1_11295 [Pseudobdellovibrionaceae bacterium]
MDYFETQNHEMNALKARMERVEKENAEMKSRLERIEKELSL